MAQIQRANPSWDWAVVAAAIAAAIGAALIVATAQGMRIAPLEGPTRPFGPAPAEATTVPATAAPALTAAPPATLAPANAPAQATAPAVPTAKAPPVEIELQSAPPQFQPGANRIPPPAIPPQR
jgi:hypothetical protein